MNQERYKNEYRHIWRERRSLINVESHIRQYLDQRDILGSSHHYSFIFAFDGVAEELHRDEDNRVWKRLGRKLLYKRFVRKLFADGKNLRNEFLNFLFELKNTNFSQITDPKLIILFKKSYELHSRLRGVFKITRGEFMEQAEQALKKLIMSRVKNAKKAQEIFEILTTPHELDQINQEIVDWLKLLEKNKINKYLIAEHLYKYPWLVAHTYNRDVITKELLKKYYHDKKDVTDWEHKARNLKKQKKRLRKKQNYLLRRFKNKKINYLSWLFCEASLERMRLKGGWSGSDYLYSSLFNEIAHRTNISIDDLYSFYRIDEVIKSIKQHKPTVSYKELQKRKLSYVLWLRAGRLYFFSGKQATVVIKQELKKYTKEIENNVLLHGKTASLGIARGRVRIVIPGNLIALKDQSKRLKKDFVLVTPMTQPNMIPYIKRAIAIVTDEGGLISHAAIIAREFKIPCVVGTEIATKIFKNGDIIEVDAEKGIVRKVK